MGGRLELAGELTYSHARTPIAVSGGTYYSNGVPNSATANVFIGAESFTDITSELTQLRLAALYALDKQRRRSASATPTESSSRPTGRTTPTRSPRSASSRSRTTSVRRSRSPNYDVNVVGVSYVYRFR